MEIKELYPVSEELAALKAEKDQELIDIITGASDKFMVIIGPCSADNEEAVVITSAVLQKFRKKSKISLSLYRVFTRTSRVQPAKATKVCFISQILKRHPIF